MNWKPFFQRCGAAILRIWYSGGIDQRSGNGADSRSRLDCGNRDRYQPKRWFPAPR